MAIEDLNQYKGLYEDKTEKSVVAATIVDAATILTTVTQEPNLVQKTQSGIQVSVPSALVSFLADVLPAEAVSGGCKATPSSYTVEDGTHVIFSALASSGWTFANWTRDGVVLTDSATPTPAPLPAVADIAVVAGTPPSNEPVHYVANFFVYAT